MIQKICALCTHIFKATNSYRARNAAGELYISNEIGEEHTSGALAALILLALCKG
jgi:hypothetical protein